MRLYTFNADGQQHLGAEKNRSGELVHLHAIEPAIPSRFRERTPGAKLHRLARWMGSASDEEMYRVLSTRWDPADRLVVGHVPMQLPTDSTFVQLNGEFELLERMLAQLP